MANQSTIGEKPAVMLYVMLALNDTAKWQRVVATSVGKNLKIAQVISSSLTI